MKRPQLSLRDLFWLVLVAAIGVGWGVDHAGEVEELRRLSMHWRLGAPPRKLEPSAASLARAELIKELQELSNAQLSDRLGELLNVGRRGRGPEYEPCLAEMVRRRMCAELQKHFDQLMTCESKILGLPVFPENRGLLTALRRAQGEPDPLKLHVELCHEDNRGARMSVPQIQVTIENVDLGKESVFHAERGSYDDSWQVQLTDAMGQRVSASNFPSSHFSYLGFQLYSSGPMVFSERSEQASQLDARHYVKAPSPGEYQVQVFYSGDSIAREPNLDGLIVLKSEPIDVIVEWPNGVDREHSVIPPIAILSVTVASCLWLAIRRFTKARNGGRAAPLVRWRNMAWLTLVLALAAGWVVDNRRLAFEIVRLTPDQEANWTMWLVE